MDRFSAKDAKSVSVSPSLRQLNDAWAALKNQFERGTFIANNCKLVLKKHYLRMEMTESTTVE